LAVHRLKGIAGRDDGCDPIANDRRQYGQDENEYRCATHRLAQRYCGGAAVAVDHLQDVRFGTVVTRGEAVAMRGMNGNHLTIQLVRPSVHIEAGDTASVDQRPAESQV